MQNQRISPSPTPTDMMNSGGSISTLSNEDKNMAAAAVVMSSEESSSYPDDDDSQLELGLGLTLACGGKVVVGGGGGARILTAKDFDFPASTSSMVVLTDHNNNNSNNNKAAASSSSSSCSAVTTRPSTINGGVSSNCGTKRTAEPSSPPLRSAPALNQVVGWPPVKNYRMNSLVNNAKVSAAEEFVSADDKSKKKNAFEDMCGNRTNDIVKKSSSYVKVNMDGIPIGRKVDLAPHSCYETLARALDNMFRPSAAAGMKGTAIEEQVIVAGSRRPIRLLDGLSEFVLTYEDKDGDLMLVGDVPWEMFLSSVRRLRIMRTTEANGISNIP